LTLPPEIIGTIVSYVSAIDLTRLQRTCHVLSSHAHTDKYWQRLIQDNVPGVKVTTTGLCSSFQALYKAHDPHWFLPKYKLWFCDNPFTGKMIIARFDLNRACIEGYRLVAERTLPTFETWKENEVVLIHSFEHRCRLHMDQPVLKLDATPYFSSETNRLSQEIRMRMDERNSNGVFASFLLTRPVEERGNMQLWPPKNIPSHHRVRNASQQLFKGEGHKPSRRSEVCDTSFRIRRWMEMVTPSSPTSPGIHLGEEVYTYSTLDPKWYTPTAEKPWRGIWVGDYSGHGCEFLLMNQPDNIIPFDEESVVQCADETVEEWEERKKVERVYRGSIEAIKLTGDPNIPRGEYTFVADDISEKAYIRTATEAPFKGARIVKSRGHIANRMYENGMFVCSARFFYLVYVDKPLSPTLPQHSLPTSIN